MQALVLAHITAADMGFGLGLLALGVLAGILLAARSRGTVR